MRRAFVARSVQRSGARFWLSKIKAFISNQLRLLFIDRDKKIRSLAFNKHAFIVGNGPSADLGENFSRVVNTSGRSDFCLIAVNFFHLNPFFEHCAPDIVVFADPATLSDDTNPILKPKNAGLKSALSANPDIIICLPVARAGEKIFKQLKNRKIYFDDSSLISYTRPIRINPYSFLPMTIFFALEIGSRFKGKKYVLGVDSDWFRRIFVINERKLVLVDHHAGGLSSEVELNEYAGLGDYLVEVGIVINSFNNFSEFDFRLVGSNNVLNCFQRVEPGQFLSENFQNAD